MAFLKSIGDIASAISSANDLASTASSLINSVKDNKKDDGTNKSNNVTSVNQEGRFSKKIENLINLILEDGDMSEEEREMLARVAEKEGFDPDEVIFIVKKRLKLSKKSGNSLKTVDQLPTVSPAKILAEEISKIDRKFDAAIEAIYAGDSSAFSSILDTLTGGVSGLAVSIGKKLFTKSDEDKILELEEQREIQISRVVASVTTPNEFCELLELLEFVNNQSQQREEGAWDDLHLALSKRGLIMVGDDEIKKKQLDMFLHKSLLPKKKKRFGLF